MAKKPKAASAELTPTEPEEIEPGAFKDAVEAARAAATKGAGRPVSITPAIVAEICIRMSEGETINAICADERMPGRSTVKRWRLNYPEFSELYDAAHAMLVEHWADEIMDIADDSRNDFVAKQKGEETVMAFDPEAVQRAKLRIETRKWMLSKLMQSKYGDKLEVGGKDGGPITVRFVE